MASPSVEQAVTKLLADRKMVSLLSVDILATEADFVVADEARSSNKEFQLSA